MKISIVSKDPRYLLVKELLSQKGFNAQILLPDEVENCDVVLLPVRKELDAFELKQLLSGIDKETVVLCGNDERVGSLFNGKIINYANFDDFVEANACLTAEATVSFLHGVTKDSVRGKRIFVSGYGRIGRVLSKILKALGSTVYAYARRDEVKEQMHIDGVISASMDNCIDCDIIINTVPSPIYSQDLIDKIPINTTIVELASSPYGFTSLERVIIAAGLPGKVLPKRAAIIVFDTIYNILSKAEKE